MHRHLRTATPSRICLPRQRLRSIATDASIPSKANDGIRLLYEDHNFLLLWKTNNVAIGISDSKLFRPAALPVDEWCRKYLKKKSFGMVAHVTNAVSGIILVAKSVAAQSSVKEYCDQFVCTFQLVVQGRPDLSQAVESGTQVSGFEWRILDTKRSGSYGNLSLVEVHIPSNVSRIKINDVIEYFSSIGSKCLTQSSGYYAALVEMQIPFAHLFAITSGGRHFHTTDYDLSLNIEGYRILVARHPTPAKFSKLLKREEIQFNRIRELQTPVLVNEAISTDNTNSRSLSTLFMGCEIAVSHNSLFPRRSSEIIATTAIDYLNQFKSQRSMNSQTEGAKFGYTAPRVLELGCGSGALLLAVLKGVSCVMGTGLDLDAESLKLAKANAVQNDQLIKDQVESGGETALQFEERCKWICGDFGDLHNLFRRNSRYELRHDDDLGLLHDEFTSGISQADCDRRVIIDRSLRNVQESLHDDGYDVIISNPPYLSVKAAAGRLTHEGKHVLVSGRTGLECYAAICSSILRSEGIGSESVAAKREQSQISSKRQNPLAVSEAEKPEADSKLDNISRESDEELSLRQSRGLLRPGGVLIFQTPGGDRGLYSVQRLAEALQFRTIETRRDYRGALRCLVLARRSRNSTAVQIGS